MELMVLKDKAMFYDKMIEAFRKGRSAQSVYNKLCDINEEARKYGI